MKQLQHRHDIDGLRALAILPVLLYHAHLGFPGGYVGVDVFFVISGFLITRLLFNELQEGRFSFMRFWERRVRRIMPPLIVMAIVVLVTGWLVLLPRDFSELSGSVVAMATVMSNHYFWAHSGYFARAADVKPLLHTWSLSVEEQFYIIFPALLLILYKSFNHRVFALLAWTAAGSLALSVYLSWTHPVPNFYLLPTRAWELIVGSLVAIYRGRDPLKLGSSSALAWTGLGLIIAPLFLYTNKTRFPGLSALPPSLGAAMIIYAGSNGTNTLARVLSNKVLVGIGLLSYSLYLWHWPIIVFAKYWFPDKFGWEASMLAVGISFAFAYLSWRYVEAPVRSRVALRNTRALFTTVTASLVTLALIGVAISRSNQGRSESAAIAQSYADGSTNRAFWLEVDLNDAKHHNFGTLGASSPEANPSVLLWGDSHAMAIAPLINAILEENGKRGLQATHSSTPPLIGFKSFYRLGLGNDSPEWSEAILDHIQTHQIPNVVLACAWTIPIQQSLADGAFERLRSNLKETVRRLRSVGAQVWIVKDVPNHHFDVPRVLSRTVFFGGDPDSVGEPVEHYKRQLVQEDQLFLGLENEGIHILDPSSLFIKTSDHCRVHDHAQALFQDEDHLSVAGALYLRPVFKTLSDKIRTN